jgi:peroxiredoxin
MRHALRIGVVCRSMALVAISCVVGCTPSSTASPDRAAADAEATPAADAEDVADDSAQETASADTLPDVTTEVVAVEDSSEDAAPAKGAAAEFDDPEARETAKPVVEEYAAGVPRVMLTAAHAKLCKVGVGDVLPTLELPTLAGDAANLESLAGAKATVVLFWTPDRWMARTAMGDLMRDAVGAYDADAVAVVGIAVNTPADEAGKAAADAGATFPQLADADGAAFAQVGENALPRIYVLDAERRIAWFDLEYSEATRRELQQTLAALAGEER